MEAGKPNHNNKSNKPALLKFTLSGVVILLIIIKYWFSLLGLIKRVFSLLGLIKLCGRFLQQSEVVIKVQLNFLRVSNGLAKLLGKSF